MKANELRTGNWANNNEEDYQITSATIAQIERGDSTAKPIQITEEWLSKFGFVPNGFSMDKGEFNVEIWLESEIGHTFKWNDFVISIRLKHIHQLQNLYFALTGEELEIK